MPFASRGVRASLLIVAALLAASPCFARHRHSPAAPRAVRAAPHSFYPNDVEGGVKGNLTFNNQIRKHTDPLNANGGK